MLKNLVIVFFSFKLIYVYYMYVSFAHYYLFFYVYVVRYTLIHDMYVCTLNIILLWILHG